MPLGGPSSYVPTIGLFLTHWDAVNTELGVGGPLVLPDGTTRAQLETMRDDLQTFAATIQNKISDREIARGTIDLNKAERIKRLNEFNRSVRSDLARTPYVRALPDVPSVEAGEARILAPLDDMSGLWAKINAATIPNFTPPLLLIGGYDIATFDTDLAALKTAYHSYQDAEQVLKLEREKRNDVQDLARPVLRDYRLAVQAAFPPEHALVESLPALSPAPGSTPDGVTASGNWDDVAGEAVITWAESTDPNIAHYDIRMTPGPTYDTDSDSVVGTEPIGATEHRTTSGLANSGDVATFRVYVVLITGNEAGSNDVTITRP